MSSTEVVEAVAAIAREADRLEPELVDFTRRIIAIPSVTGQEGPVVEFVAGAMQAFGFGRVFVDRIGNVVGQVGSGRLKIMYDAHLDTVDAGDRSAWPWDPFEGRLEDGVIYGRGASDDKGAFASMLFGARILKELAAAGDFTLYVVGSVGEENGEGLALSVLVEEEGLHPDCVVIGEASELTLRRGHRGRALLAMSFAGRQVHASAPELGDNPIYKAAPVIRAVEELHRRLVTSAGHPFLGHGSAAVTRLDSSAPSLNTIPGKATIYIDRRLTAGETREVILAELQALPGAEGATVAIVKMDEPSHTGYRKPCEEYFPPWYLPEDHPLVQAGAEAYRLALGRRPVIERWNFSTNGTYTMGVKGIPTIGFGPGEGRYCHTSEDQVPVRHLTEAAKFYAALPLVLVERQFREDA
jgi:putative selenium metabolism hydrolase